MIDTGPILRKVADLADELEAMYGEDARIELAMVAVEVSVEDNDGKRTTIVEHRSTTYSTAHALGLAELLCDSLREPFERDPDDGPDDLVD